MAAWGRQGTGGRRSGPGGGRRPAGRRQGGRRRGGAQARRPAAIGTAELAGRLARSALPNTRLKAGGGLGAAVVVAEAVGGQWDLGCAVADGTARTPGGEQGAIRYARRLASRARVARLAAILAALGSPHRLKLLLKLLEGPATYKTLQKATGLKAGPLYHHVAQLRLAALVGPKERDLYELTRGGRNVVLVALSLPSLAKDRRRRPVAGARSQPPKPARG